MDSSKKALLKRRAAMSRGRDDGSESFGFLKNSVLSAALALAGAIILTFLVTAAIFRTADPARLAVPSAAAILCISAVACGFIAAKLSRGASLSSGLLSGTIFELFVLAVAFIIGRKGMTMPAGLRALFFGILVPLSAVGSAIGGMKLSGKRRTTIRRK